MMSRDGHLDRSLETVPQSTLARIRSIYPTLSEAEQRVADAIEQQAVDVVQMPVKQLAKFIGVSEATVVRCCQSLGYRGLRDLKATLASEALTTHRILHEDVNLTDSISEVISKSFRSDMQAISDTLALIDESAIAQAVQALLDASRIECYGMGGSMPMALHAHQRFLRIGLPATIAGDSYHQAVSAARLPPGSVAFAITYSGLTDEMLVTLREAKEAGARCVLVTSYANSPIGKHVDIQLVVAQRRSSVRSGIIESRMSTHALIDALSLLVAMQRPEEVRTALIQTGTLLGRRKARADE